MTAAIRRQQTVESMVPWWAVLIEGIALLVLGILFLTNTAATTLIFVQILGIYWLIRGIFQLVSMFVDKTMWGWKLFAGLLGVLAGIVVIQHPLYSPFVIGSTLIIILGIQAIIGGAIGLWQAFKGAGWGAGILGAITLIIGVWLLGNIGAATLALPWTIGLLAIAGGLASIFFALRLR